MPLAHPGCACSHKIFSLFDSTLLFCLMRRRRCRCTTSASHVVRLSLCVPLFISSRFCCLSSDTDLLLFPYVPYPLALSTHDAYVNRTVTYDHATSTWRSTIYSFLTSTTDIILFYFSSTFSSSTMMRYLFYRTYRCRFPPGGLGVCKGKAGCPLYVYILEKLSNKSKFESSYERPKTKKSNEAKCKGTQTDLRITRTLYIRVLQYTELNVLTPRSNCASPHGTHLPEAGRLVFTTGSAFSRSALS